MHLEDIVAICDKLKGVTKDIKWEDHLCFNVGDKMFLVTSPDGVPVTASFKVSDEDFEELIVRDGFSPAPYLARYKWVYLDDINHLTNSEWQKYIANSYLLISAKLPRKVKDGLGIV